MIILKTAQKIAIARVLSSMVLGLRRLLGKSAGATVRRGGLCWKLDLTEGIDFSIYFLGGFEPRTLRLYSRWVKPGDTVLDIGANIGAHTLPLAQLAGPGGRVIAFEPTTYAVQKLRANIGLNPTISNRIVVCQVMLVASSDAMLASELYSSWPLVTGRSELHPQHGGRLMETTGAAVKTLDQAVKELAIEKVSFIKVDVDGNENSVLAGGNETVQAHRPAILMELSPYLSQTGCNDFEQMLRRLGMLNYRLTDADTGKDLPLDAALLGRLIPTGGTRNGLFFPK